MDPLLKGKLGMVPIVAVQAYYAGGTAQGLGYHPCQCAFSAAASAAYAYNYHIISPALFFYYNCHNGN